MSDKTMDSYVDMIAKESVESMETGKAQNFNQDVELFGNKFPFPKGTIICHKNWIFLLS